MSTEKRDVEKELRDSGAEISDELKETYEALRRACYGWPRKVQRADAFQRFARMNTELDPPLDDRQLESFFDERWDWHSARVTPQQEKPMPPMGIELVMTAGAFLKLELPPREPIIAGFLFKQSIAEIVGFRGCGKTWFGLSLARAISEGSRFLEWDAPARRRVLYVDGEMAARELQDRMRGMFGLTPPDLFELMPSEIFHKATDGSLTINNPEHQERFEGLLTALAAAERRPEVIIFDNLSALTVGIDENSSTDFQVLKAWFTRLRHMGYTIIFVHHAGKSGDQRGTSAREDNLDMTVKLTEPAQRTELTRIEMEIGKCRGERPKPDQCEVALVRDAEGLLQLAVSRTVARRRQAGEIEQQFHVLRFISESDGAVTRKEVAKEFDIGKSNANEHVSKLIKKTFLSGERGGALSVTETGWKKLVDLWPETDVPM